MRRAPPAHPCTALTAAAGQHGPGIPDPVRELGGFEDLGVSAPAQDPAFDLLEAAQDQAQLQIVPGQTPDFLGGMPLPFRNEPGRDAIEPDPDLVPGLAFEHTETVAQMITDREIGGPLELVPGIAQGAHPGEGKGAELTADKVESEQVPLVLDTGEVVGLDPADLVAPAFQFAVLELNLVLVENGAAKRFKEFEVGTAVADAAERNGGPDVGPVELDLVMKPVGDFFERGPEGFLERGCRGTVQAPSGQRGARRSRLPTP